MRKTDFLEQLRHRLVDLGCPIVHVQRLVQEVADHREDLKQAAVLEGLPESTAETRADTQLGDPLDLAEHLMVALRRSSWWGRHFIIGFCLLPLLAVPVLWGLLLFLDVSLEFALGYGWDSKKLHVAADNPGAFHHLVIAVHCADFVAIALVTLLFYWLARRSAVGFRWMMTAGAICSLYALFSWVQIRPHSFTLGITWTPQWIRAAIPLSILAAAYTLRWRTTRCFRENVAI
jgi:hypothetical protein